jgi:hypothetical protein
VIGAAVVVGLPAWVPNVVGGFVGSAKAAAYGPKVEQITYGVLTILFVVASTDGIVGLLRQLRKLVRKAIARTRPIKDEPKIQGTLQEANSWE